MSGLDLTGVPFTDADLIDADLSGAILAGNDWTGTVCPDATLAAGTCCGHQVGGAPAVCTP